MQLGEGRESRGRWGGLRGEAGRAQGGGVGGDNGASPEKREGGKDRGKPRSSRASGHQSTRLSRHHRPPPPPLAAATAPKPCADTAQGMIELVPSPLPPL